MHLCWPEARTVAGTSSPAGQAIRTKWKETERSPKPCSALQRLFGELVLKKTTSSLGPQAHNTDDELGERGHTS